MDVMTTVIRALEPDAATLRQLDDLMLTGAGESLRFSNTPGKVGSIPLQLLALGAFANLVPELLGFDDQDWLRA